MANDIVYCVIFLLNLAVFLIRWVLKYWLPLALVFGSALVARRIVKRLEELIEMSSWKSYKIEEGE